MIAQQIPTIKSCPRENGLSRESREKIGKTAKTKGKIEAGKERIEKTERTGKAKKSRKNSRSKKNRMRKQRQPELVGDSQFLNNLYNYAINAPSDQDSASFDEQRKDRQTKKYWMRQSRRSLGGKTKVEEDSYDSDLLNDDYDDIGQREIRASTSIDDLFDSKYDMNCLAWDPLTGRCINSRRSGCFGDSSDDGGLMGC